jgi:hypothetical protein
MAKNARPTSNKRAREKAQQERQKEKQQRRLEAKERKGTPLAAESGGEDPDLAGIRPGPQPRPDWLVELDAENEAEADDSENRQ